MRIRRCGDSGLAVSELGLGTLTWGRDTDAPEAEAMLDAFLGAGGNLLGVSPTHGDGQAVDVLASLLPRVGRHRVVLVWRGAARLGHDGRWHPSAARGDMLSCLDDALERLGTDHVDVWLATPDPAVPLEETLSALDVAWRSGRTRYTGTSHLGTWDTALAHARGASDGPTPVVLEESYSLLDRRVETGLLPSAAGAGMGLLAHSPLAGGVLTGKYRRSTPPDSRAASPHLHHLVEPFLGPRHAGVVEAVVRAAEGLGRTPLDVALSWVRDAPGVSSAVVGPRNARQMGQALEGGGELPVQIRQVLDEVSRG
ncbi:aldo/keto reductase [Actinomyces polynesiensis]|uniref:aldo/keto reductase n=1 Tax=Actinomyces polynesiensis TaxID=1325934 RepID=UPI0005BB5B0B|nr:aldo/keto reductase [Actinomyces polynesiensis]